MVRKKTIYKVIKYVMIIIAYIIAFKTIFHDFKPEYLISWNAFSKWWIDTYTGLFKMILSIILGITLIWGIGWLLWKWFRAFFIFIFRHNPEIIDTLMNYGGARIQFLYLKKCELKNIVKNVLET